jgi:alpha-tubulin suppressor-like RCC1 family protein
MSYYDDLLAVIASYGEPPVSGGKFIFSTKGDFSFYLTSGGDLYAAGQNNYYQLGNNSTDPLQTWTLVAQNVETVACGFYHSLYVSTSGAFVWLWVYYF